jgi:dihydroorotate dehydrogenase
VNWYSEILRPALFRLDAELAHEFAIHGLELSGRIPGALRAAFGQTPVCPTSAFGIHFPNPVGLAAGMDKNAVALPAWEALGFGFVEVGTITAKAQPGNPKPRLFRYPEIGALVNRFGFNNDGADAVARRLSALKDSGRWPRIPVGVNIGKSKVTALEDAAADYLHSYRSLHAFADYFVVNVSSPNTPGLRELQDRGALAKIIETLRSHDSTKPLFVKIAPDLNPDQIDDILDLTNQADLTGLVVTNTTLDHSALPPGRDEAGGLSGVPLREKSAAILSFIRERSSRALIASGGICDGKDGADRIAQGATLVQIYTGFVYHGPPLIRDICSAL